uniref:Uncharacterized protein n=1 Tax=Meloidogyne enterolobii TaxID=390850 RepID=A0A6V7VCL6_MELEN|nr:unnamed protein product [Meloidogyne enterolobii]
MNKMVGLCCELPHKTLLNFGPPSPAPKWVARLNFRPLLTSGPRLEVSQADLSSGEGAVCFFVGFTTTEKGKNIIKKSLKF